MMAMMVVKYFIVSPNPLLKFYLLHLFAKIAEVIDERPEEVKQLEAFRTSNRWKVIGGNWYLS